MRQLDDGDRANQRMPGFLIKPCARCTGQPTLNGCSLALGAATPHSESPGGRDKL